jgi:hypothetical protein
MGDDVLWISLAEALNYIANESDQAHEAALKLVGDGGKSDSRNEKFESDVVEADLVTWGTSKPPEQARFSEPPAPYQIHLSLLGAATEAFKEGARRGIRCRGTHPVTRERVDIEFGDWPVLVIPVEAAFSEKGEVFTEVKGVTIPAYENVTVDWPDLARQFPRPSIEKIAPPAPPPDKQLDRPANPDAQSLPRASRRRRNQGGGTQTIRARAVLKRMCPQGYPTEETESSVDLWERFTKEYEEYKKDEAKAGRPSRYPVPSKSVVMREIGRKKK